MGAASVEVHEHLDGVLATPYVGEAALVVSEHLVLRKESSVSTLLALWQRVVLVEGLLVHELPEHRHQPLALRLRVDSFRFILR